MARELKTRFPCKWGCGTLAPVARLKDAAHAECVPCAYKRQAVSRVGWADNSASEHIGNAEELRDDPKAKVSGRYLPAKPDNFEGQLVEWLEAAGERIQAASRAIQAISLHTEGADRRRLARIAKNRASLACGILDQLPGLLDDLIEKQGRGLKLVDAPPAPTQAELEVVISSPLPRLRLVKAVEPVAPPDGAER